jgi:hypothetical protein
MDFHDAKEMHTNSDEKLKDGTIVDREYMKDNKVNCSKKKNR